MNLFQLGNFTLSSGNPSAWNIECEALTPADWATLAYLTAQRAKEFRDVVGVPRGGLPFADALRPYAVDAGPILVVDDVLTTGG